MEWWLLRNKFLESFKAEEESGLLQSSSAGFSVLFTPFLQIKSLIEDLETGSDSEMQTGVRMEAVSVLHELNDALARTRILANECQEELHKQQKLLFFIKYTLSNYYFIRRMKRKLNSITSELEPLLIEKRQDKRRGKRRYKTEINRPFQELPLLSLTDDEIWGFDEQANKIEGLLFDGNNGGFRAVGIVGVGGSGKTTLARRVLRSRSVKERFSPVITICFSDAREVNNPVDETPIKFGQYVLGELGGKHTSNDIFDDLVERLSRLLTGKRYLIVLDDVWHGNSFFSDIPGCRPSPGGGKRLSDGLPKDGGGAVIVTTRTTEVARDMVGQKNLIRVQPLDDESCWRIFMRSVPPHHSEVSHKLEKMKIEITSRFHGLPLAATALAQVIPRRIHSMDKKNSEEQRQMDIESANRDVRTEMPIPAYCLNPAYAVSELEWLPSCPVLVFVDMGNKQIGQRVVDEVRIFLRENQVYHVLQEKSNSEQIDEAENPEIVLKKVYMNLEKLKHNGDDFASAIQERMRIIVLGGNAVANWILQVICDLKLLVPPPIALIPLETENDFAVSFGWETRNLGRHSRYVKIVKSILNQVNKAKEMKIDSWHLLMRMRAPREAPCDPIAPLELPLSLHPFDLGSNTDELNKDGIHTFRGGFWNYFSIGRDAQVSYERKLHPKKFKFIQTTCSSRSTSRNLAQFIKVMIMKNSKWEEMVIPQSIETIVCLNLPSFSGGFNWEIPDSRKHYNRHFTPSYVDDGLIEIVGYRGARRGLVFLAPKGHGIRLAQVNRIRFVIHRDSFNHTYMTMDGQPWRQPLPVDDETVMVEISRHSQASILVTHGCKCRTVFDPISADDEEVSDEEIMSAEFRKFGAADKFQLPEENDISLFS